MGCREYEHWRQFDRMYGFGEQRMDARFAKMTMHVIAAMPFRQGTVRLRDFLLDAEQDDPAPVDLSAAAFDAAAKGCTHGR